MTDRATALDATIKAQSRAADPQGSAWVAANAGTGKTHVLTKRILRLLLQGTSPERILALTYTKAAASEMARRTFDTLSSWVTLQDQAFVAALETLLDRTPTVEEGQRARELFARAIETPGGLKVQTIHAFCERLLKRFPLEAGVSPHFAILDEALAEELRRASIDQTLVRATAAPHSPLGQALQAAIVYAVDDQFDEVLREALAARDWIETVARMGLTAPGGNNAPLASVDKAYRKALNLSDDDTLASLTTRMAAIVDDATCADAVRALAEGGKTDIKLSEALQRARKAKTSEERVAALSDALLTATGQPRADSRFITKKVRERDPHLTSQLERARDQLASMMERRDTLRLHDATMALITITMDVAQAFHDAKARRAALDFDDLIEKTGRLIGRPGTAGQASAAEWVLYKLDGGIDHILVDEAQDTSRPQWAVVEGLAQAFFDTGGARGDDQRTVFAVGDEKQSIYGFQGAAPKMFQDMAQLFSREAKRAGRPFHRVPLTLSFRTVAPILELVDRVFSNAGRTPGLVAEASTIRHDAFRQGQAGLVELWPLEPYEKPVDSDPYAPLDDAAPASPLTLLANRIADQIEVWVNNGERLVSENRPVEPGDILVLVRRRKPLGPLIVSELKRRKIAVAGADRLLLLDQLAVEDLLSLGDFLTLPEDDLALACVLKSPICNLTDDDLLVMAPRRKGTLWQAMLQMARTDPRLGAVADRLKRWRGEADFLPPYEFFAHLLEADNGALRRGFLERLGAEAADALDEFLNLALEYDDVEPPSMAGFLTWVRNSEHQIKRDMEQGRNEVRIMTVHGAKGLEAPIVFLPDTTATRSGNRATLLRSETTILNAQPTDTAFWRVKGTGRVGLIEDAAASQAEAEFEERNRLLYVALTRARDRLYVCGAEPKSKLDDKSWYALVRAGLEGVATPVTGPDGRTVLRLESAQAAPHERSRSPGQAVRSVDPLPAWALRPAPKDVSLSIPLTPSRLAPLEIDDEGDAAPPPLDRSAEPARLPRAAPVDTEPENETRFLRGTLTHTLLQVLPDLPKADWARAAQAFVNVKGQRLSPAVRHATVAETIGILTEPSVSHVFGHGSRAEVSFVADVQRPAGRAGPPLRVHGQIDRLIVQQDAVWIIDYKTNRHPPTRLEDVPEAYLLQLAAYRLALKQCMTASVVHCALIWTDGPKLMAVPHDLLEAAEARLWALDATKR